MDKPTECPACGETVIDIEVPSQIIFACGQIYELSKSGGKWKSAKTCNAAFDSAVSLRAAAPSPAQGWRLLEVGEVIQEGDEYYSYYWKSIVEEIGVENGGAWPIRRRIAAPPPPAPTYPLETICANCGYTFGMHGKLDATCFGKAITKFSPVVTPSDDVQRVVDAARNVYLKLIVPLEVSIEMTAEDLNMTADVVALGEALAMLDARRRGAAKEGKGR